LIANPSERQNKLVIKCIGIHVGSFPARNKIDINRRKGMTILTVELSYPSFYPVSHDCPANLAAGCYSYTWGTDTEVLPDDYESCPVYNPVATSKTSEIRTP